MSMRDKDLRWEPNDTRISQESRVQGQEYPFHNAYAEPDSTSPLPWEEELASFSPEQSSIITIGVFDGVHVGHQYLIRRLVSQAQARGYLSGVVTFHPHPQEVLKSQTTPLPTRLSHLSTLEKKIELLLNVGVSFVVPFTFTPEIAQIGARDFVVALCKHLKMEGLVIGPDFALGRGREGDATLLTSLGKEIGFTVETIDFVKLDDKVVSSTAIRQALAQGDVIAARKFLGYPFTLCGQVGHGVKRGGSLGYPTANLEVDQNLALPSNGVYVTMTKVGAQTYPSVTNIGIRPTFGEEKRTIEVYLLDVELELYQQELEIEFVDRLREEKRFPAASDLSAQIRKDVEQARKILIIG